MSVTAKQLRFIDEYCLSHCAADAARRAGYSERTAKSIGHENLTKPDVMAAIQARQDVTARELGLTKENVLQELLDAIAAARIQGNPMAMISGAREIGKMLGFYDPEVHKVEMTADSNRLAAKYEAMSDAELLAIISADQQVG